MNDQLTLVENAKRPEPRAFECIEEMGVGFRGIERSEYLTADDHHRTEPARFGARCDSHCFEEICRTIPPEITHCAHGPGEYNRLFGRK
jgi:hypothetical protein